MAILFHPKPGMVLICDFNTGFIPPEMVKKRRVVVVSPARLNNVLCRVVPISTTPPYEELAHHHRFEAAQYQFFSQDKPCWAKCDLVTTVSLKRLDRLRVNGLFISPSLSASDFQHVMNAVYSSFKETLP